MGPVGPALALACRIVLAAVLAVAAVAKVVDRRELPDRLLAMGIAPRALAVSVAVALPVVELAVAISLVVVPHSAWPAFAALAMLGGFTGVLLATVRRAVPCPCFGAVRSGPPGSVAGVVMRNGLLIALGVLATGSITGARAGGTAVVTAIGLAASAVVVTRVP
jgi:hypothetical protein